jgi:hypothetical protein
MNNVRALVQSSRPPFGPTLNSEAMLSELLTLHEEMIAQLRRHRNGGCIDPDLMSAMIGQHETAAAKLRLQLGQYVARAS